jgi:hypothetical protein
VWWLGGDRHLVRGDGLVVAGTEPFDAFFELADANSDSGVGRINNCVQLAPVDARMDAERQPEPRDRFVKWHEERASGAPEVSCESLAQTGTYLWRIQDPRVTTRSTSV